jgi:hypothetical protein
VISPEISSKTPKSSRYGA